MSLNKNCFRILMLICRLRFFYYQFYVEVINFELSVIEKEAKKMFETSMNDFFGGINNPFELQRLKWIREYYAIIQKMSVFVNAIFGWSNVALILYCFQGFWFSMELLYVLIPLVGFYFSRMKFAVILAREVHAIFPIFYIFEASKRSVAKVSLQERCFNK